MRSGQRAQPTCSVMGSSEMADPAGVRELALYPYVRQSLDADVTLGLY